MLPATSAHFKTRLEFLCQLETERDTPMVDASTYFLCNSLASPSGSGTQGTIPFSTADATFM